MPRQRQPIGKTLPTNRQHLACPKATACQQTGKSLPASRQETRCHCRTFCLRASAISRPNGVSMSAAQLYDPGHGSPCGVEQEEEGTSKGNPSSASKNTIFAQKLIKHMPHFPLFFPSLRQYSPLNLLNIMKRKPLLLGIISLLATATIHAQEFRIQSTPPNIFPKMTPSTFPCNTNCCPVTP